MTNASLFPRSGPSAPVFFTAGLVYALFVALLVYLDLDGYEGSAITALYLCGFLGGIGFFIMARAYGTVDRHRRIVMDILEKSHRAHIIVGPLGETVYANPSFSTLMASGERPTLTTVLSALEGSQAVPPPADRGEWRAQLKNRPVWFQVACRPVEGCPGFVHWSFDDVTVRHQAETALAGERGRLRDFTDNAPVGLFSVDADGVFLFVNATLAQWLDTPAAELTGKKRLHDILAMPPPTGSPYDCLESGGDIQQGETTFRTLGPHPRELRVAITHSLRRCEKAQGIVSHSIVHDLTFEQKMRAALHESEGRFRRLFEEAPVGIGMLNARGILTDSNQTLAAMLARTGGEVSGRPLLDFIGANSQKRVGEWLRQISRGMKTPPALEVALKGGPEKSVQLYARKFVGSDDFVLHFIDLTDQKNLEKKFAQSQKMQAVGQLAGGVAHDFNNLLTAMIGFADLLLLRHKPGDPSFADIMHIKQNANRAASLVRQLLAFSRQQTLQPRVLDLTDVMTDLSHLLRRLIGTNIDLVIAHGTDLGLIKADHGQIEQVLINLAVNARDAMPGGGRLSIRTGNVRNRAELRLGGEEILPAGEWVMIEVEDTGTGIPADILPNIFEPFFTTKAVGAGTGLGLATVHGIIHQTGGFIGVASTPGQGTTFTLYLPRHHGGAEEEKPDVAEDRASVADLTGSARILLVEDEDAVRVFSARALSNKGYRVADAASGKIALQMLEEKKIEPDVLITDVMMPEMDGTTLAKIVREKYPGIKIVFISGYAEDRFKEHLGADVHFLPKPFTLKQLATKVKELLDGGEGA